MILQNLLRLGAYGKGPPDKPTRQHIYGCVVSTKLLTYYIIWEDFITPNSFRNRWGRGVL